MSALWNWLRHEPPPVFGLVMGAVVLGGLGALVGLVIGLYAYPPTAWAAAFEIGLPAGLVGGLLGLGIGILSGART